MNIVIWMLAGGALGWIGCVYLGFNEGRGRMVSVVIGAVGGLIGGKLIAPMFGASGAAAGDFSAIALVLAVAVATAFVYLGNLIHDRWGV
jgi:uncharacterized membrane protein YeaQ/YmgE (transglycosylase-associated protein family)